MIIILNLLNKIILILKSKKAYIKEFLNIRKNNKNNTNKVKNIHSSLDNFIDFI